MIIITIITLAYLLIALWEILRLRQPERGFRRRLRWGLAGVACIHLIFLAIHFLGNETPTHSRTGLWMSFSAFALVALYLLAAFRFDMGFLGAFILPVAVAFMVLSGANGGGPADSPGSVNPWIFVHAGLILTGYAAFVMACIVAILYLIQESRLKQGRVKKAMRWLPPLDSLDKGNYHLIRLGFAALTLAIVTGLVPAFAKDGARALADLTVALTLITWVLYAILFQLRLTSTLRGRKVAILSILLVIGVVFSWAGASLIESGIHSRERAAVETTAHVSTLVEDPVAQSCPDTRKCQTESAELSGSRGVYRWHPNHTPGESA